MAYAPINVFVDTIEDPINCGEGVYNFEVATLASMPDLPLYVVRREVQTGKVDLLNFATWTAFGKELQKLGADHTIILVFADVCMDSGEIDPVLGKLKVWRASDGSTKAARSTFWGFPALQSHPEPEEEIAKGVESGDDDGIPGMREMAASLDFSELDFFNLD
jgi:hypothetical protein